MKSTDVGALRPLPHSVRGVDVDPETRCRHYHGPNDIIAIKFKCCGEWFPCHECHAELAGHDPEVWPRTEFQECAILCGACAKQLTIGEYFACNSTCPRCNRQFNPGCAEHHHLYFENQVGRGDYAPARASECTRF